MLRSVFSLYMCFTFYFHLPTLARPRRPSRRRAEATTAQRSAQGVKKGKVGKKWNEKLQLSLFCATATMKLRAVVWEQTKSILFPSIVLPELDSLLSLSLCCSENFPFVLKAVPEHRAREWESCVCRAYTLSSRHRRLHRAEQQKTHDDYECFMLYVHFFLHNSAAALFTIIVVIIHSIVSGLFEKGRRREEVGSSPSLAHAAWNKKREASSQERSKGKAAKSIDRSGEWDRE